MTQSNQTSGTISWPASAQHKGATRPDYWVAILAHELRNQMSPINAAVDLLSLHCESMPAVEHTRDILCRSVGQITDIITDVLELSRSRQLRLAPIAEYVDVAEVISDAIALAEGMLREKQHVLCVDLPADSIGIYGCSSRLNQIVSNLLINAAKYTPARGRITLSAGIVDGSLSIQVLDNGIGIDAHELPHVFEPFRTGGVGSSYRDSLGLGLAIVKTLVQQQGGTITAISDGRGHGAMFEVILPMTHLAPASSEHYLG